MKLLKFALTGIAQSDNPLNQDCGMITRGLFQYNNQDPISILHGWARSQIISEIITYVGGVFPLTEDLPSAISTALHCIPVTWIWKYDKVP